MRSVSPAGKVLPLEILPLGEFDPVYRSTLDVQNGELPVLPLSIYGAVRVDSLSFPSSESACLTLCTWEQAKRDHTRPSFIQRMVC